MRTFFKCFELGPRGGSATLVVVTEGAAVAIDRARGSVAADRTMGRVDMGRVRAMEAAEGRVARGLARAMARMSAGEYIVVVVVS